MKSLSLDDYQSLKQQAEIIGFSSKQPKSRVQLKMPTHIVKLLDKEFPQFNRSQLLTLAALEIIIRKKRAANPELEQWLGQEQHDLDRLWTYIDEREKT